MLFVPVSGYTKGLGSTLSRGFSKILVLWIGSDCVSAWIGVFNSLPSNTWFKSLNQICATVRSSPPVYVLRSTWARPEVKE